MNRRHTLRLQTFDYAGGYQYSCTICTHDRHPAFTAAEIVTPVHQRFLQCGEVAGIAILAYCFMPDHVHLLLEGQRTDSTMRSFISRAKQHSGFWYSQRSGQRLWQRSFWDRVLRAEEQAEEVARYILENPVRAGLAATWQEYPFSGSTYFPRTERPG